MVHVFSSLFYFAINKTTILSGLRFLNISVNGTPKLIEAHSALSKKELSTPQFPFCF